MNVRDRSKHRRRTTRPARWAAACLVAAGTALAQPGSDAPPDPEGIGITEHLGEQLPLELAFTNERGERVTLGDFFNDDKPGVIGLVGTIFGDHKINIADMMLSRKEKTALMVLKLDAPIPDDAMKALESKTPPIQKVLPVTLPAIAS